MLLIKTDSTGKAVAVPAYNPKPPVQKAASAVGGAAGRGAAPPGAGSPAGATPKATPMAATPSPQAVQKVEERQDDRRQRGVGCTVRRSHFCPRVVF
jgi:hypothetical protein